jgi:predicted dehydrogenase
MKLGVVGHGSIGSRHAANASALGHDVLVYDPASRRDVQFERNIYDSDVHAVVIATPSPFHEGPLRACIERGKHVLVEKPLSTSLGLLPDLLRIADDKELVVMVGCNMRFHTCVQMAKRWIADGSIGRPLWANFICATQSAKAPYLSDGVILNTGSHEVDLALHLLGPAHVISATTRAGEYGDELSNFTLEHDSGAISSFVLNFVTPNEIREFWIAGEDDNIGVDLPSRHITCKRLGSSIGPGDYDLDYVNEMRAFVDRIEGKITPGASGHDGLATLRVLLDVRKMAGLK